MEKAVKKYKKLMSLLTIHKAEWVTTLLYLFYASTVNYDYDVLDELIGKRYNIEEELSAFAYTYDKSGFITAEVAKTGKRIETSQYEYDERAQLVKVSQTVTENNKFIEETEMVYTYDGAGNRLSAVKTSGNKALCNIQYTYNDNNQVTDIRATAMMKTS